MKIVMAEIILAVAAGCSTLDQLQDLIGWNATNAPVMPAITNLPPVVVNPPATEECGCDLRLPRCTEDIRTIYDRVNGAGSHQGAGNNEVCWTAQSGQGYDFRCMFRSTNPRQRHVSSWGRKWGYDVVSRGVLDAKCFRMTQAGVTYQCHWTGWSTEEDQKIENPGVRRVVCDGRTFGFWDVYVAGGSTTNPPVVTPPVEPPTIADMPVPERLGADAYKGTGIGGTFKEVPGSGGWNPKKSVMMQAWVKINGWPRPDEGCSVINKGLVGKTWAYALKIRPGVLLYQQTQGSVYATYTWRTKEWHHVRVEADKAGIRVYVDGKIVPVTSSEVTTYIGANDQPVRVGGQQMEWSPPSEWFNASLDGEISDWEVSIQ